MGSILIAGFLWPDALCACFTCIILVNIGTYRCPPTRCEQDCQMPDAGGGVGHAPSDLPSIRCRVRLEYLSSHDLVLDSRLAFHGGHSLPMREQSANGCDDWD